MLRDRTWLKPPEFPDHPQKTYQARIIYVTLVSFLVYIPIAQIGIWLGGRSPFIGTVLQISLFILCISGMLLIRKGYINLVSITLISSTYIAVTVAIISLGTIRVPLTTTYYALIIISGLLFNLRGMAFMITLCTLSIGAIMIAQVKGMLPPPDYTITITQFSTYVALFLTNGGVTIFVIRSIRLSLQRSENENRERKKAEQALRISEEQLYRSNVELQQALAEVKTLTGMLPICAHCKKIRDDKGYWNTLEYYISEHTDATFTHGICPECAKEFLESINKNEPTL